MTGITLTPRFTMAGFALALLITQSSGAADGSIANLPTISTSDSSGRVLTTAQQVHDLTRQEAAAGRKVLIRGVITCALPEFSAAVVQDASSGIYVDRWNPSLGVIPEVGELVEIEGVTDPGQFAPVIQAVIVRRLGTQQLPAPVRPYWDQLINGSLDTQLVEIEGVVTEVYSNAVTLLTHGGKIRARVFGTTGSMYQERLNLEDGALVRLRGCLFASWDPITHAVDVSEVRMIHPAVAVMDAAPVDPFNLVPKRVIDLLQFDPHASALRRVKVTGQIVLAREGEYFAMEGTNGFRFHARQALNLEPGDLVEVVGFPSLTGPSPVLQEAVARKTGTGPLPEARPLNAANLFRVENDATRVRVRAVLLSLSGDRRTLELQAGLKRFTADVEEDSTSTERQLSRATPGRGMGIDLPLGSQLELTGVYTGSGGNRATGTEVANFELLLNSATDIRLLVRPPLWTLPRLLVLVGALLGVLGLALFWIRLLHHKVQKRTAELQKEVQDRQNAEQQRALAQERARIARDLHDDLGSNLTEITMLATANPGQNLAVQEAAERMEAIAGKSRALVNALDEIVWAVDPKRDTLASVARYLASYAEEYLAGLKIVCRVQIPNSFPDQVVSGKVRHHLFLAVKEALNNAVRHGNATEINFRVRVVKDTLSILISDNGSGFDINGRSNGNGLLNLRNRLEHLQGCCELQSSPGGGTTVSLDLPLPASNNST